MLNHSIKFEFIGFDPDYKTRSYITSVAERLQSLSPSYSFIKVAMNKGKNVVKASCKIVSQAGEFVAESLCNDPVSAILQIEADIMEQLNEWKKHRFFENQPETKVSKPLLEIAI
ncbi:MAG: hypothetical protein H6625_10705 [Bdellovibrionaceae bacterium]|nr:hypothetical protein [Pseudobdellovibrionaceae bacterium]